MVSTMQKNGTQCIELVKNNLYTQNILSISQLHYYIFYLLIKKFDITLSYLNYQL